MLNALQHRAPFSVVNDVIVSPTYIPHFVHTALDLFIDGEESIWHLSNEGGMLSWAEFAKELAKRGGYNSDKLIILSAEEMNWKARRPMYSVLQSGKGATLPSLDDAIGEFYHHSFITLQLDTKTSIMAGSKFMFTPESRIVTQYSDARRRHKRLRNGKNDHYRRWEEDFALLQDVGMSFFVMDLRI